MSQPKSGSAIAPTPTSAPWELGVGVTYMPAIEPLLWERPDLFDVVEVEPQTLWLETGDLDAPFLLPPSVLERVAALPGRKLLHSIGAPVGGSVPPNPAQFPLLRQMIARFDTPYLSDHLSFNFTPEFHTGFFLPPRQTPAAVQAIATTIHALQRQLSVPVAVETGVSYHRPRPEEMEDGAFHAAVVAAGQCGLLLDLHNLYANVLNGRQSVEAFLSQIPTERVWEVHLAGGLEMDGYYLDAHSGAVPDALFRACRDILPRLPNLRAMIFEIFPSFVEVVGLDLIRQQIERLHELWERRGRSAPPLHSRLPAGAPPTLAVPPAPEEAPTAEWERELGALAIGRAGTTELGRQLGEDAGITLVRKLIHEFRGSMVVGVLRLTSRLLMLTLGPDVFLLLLGDFWKTTPPHQFAAYEAEAFARYLEQSDLKVPHLMKVLEFEQATVQTLTDGQTRVVTFESDPLPLLRALAEGHLPEIIGQPGTFEIELTADGPIGAAGLDREALRQSFPYH